MKLRLPKPFDRRPTLVRTSLPGFDPIYYLFWYPDVRAAGLDPLRHYLLAGWKEGRDPSAGFSTSGYLAANPDVAAAGHNPLLHFVDAGFAEGRRGYLKNPAAPAPRPNHTAEPMKLISGPAMATPTSPLQGYIDEITHTSIRGWARPSNSLGMPAEVQIVANGTVVGRIAASEFRSDLRDEAIGNAHHGFRFSFDPPLDRGTGHVVVIQRVDDGLEIGRAVLQVDS